MSVQTTDHRLADLETIAGPTADELEDAADAALLHASGSMPWKALGIPGHTPGPSLSIMPALTRPTTWQARAECRDAPQDDAHAFAEARSQAEAAEVAQAYCSACLVVADCLADGRAQRGWGVYGGLTLVDGRKAPQHRPGVRAAATGRPRQRP